MSEYIIKGETLTDIADAIREKTGGTEGIDPADFAAEYRKLAGGGSGGDGVTLVAEKGAISKGDLGPWSSINGVKQYKVVAPNVGSIATRAFDRCDQLLSITLPVAEEVQFEAFWGCTALTTVDLPMATSIGDSAFSGCSALTTVDLPVATSIGGNAFLGCQNLSALILRTTETVCVCEFSALSSTPIENLQGHIYVPASMYEYYRAGYADALDAAYAEMGVSGVFDIMFRKIEDYPEICG